MTDCTTQALGQTFTNTTCVQLDTLIALTVVLIIVLIFALGWLGIGLNKFMDGVNERLGKTGPEKVTRADMVTSLCSPDSLENNESFGRFMTTSISCNFWQVIFLYSVVSQSLRQPEFANQVRDSIGSL